MDILLHFHVLSIKKRDSQLSRGPIIVDPLIKCSKNGMQN